MTKIVLHNMIRIAGKRIEEKLPQEFKSPTAAGINISGMICTRKLPVSFTEDNGTICRASAENNSISP